MPNKNVILLVKKEGIIANQQYLDKRIFLQGKRLLNIYGLNSFVVFFFSLIPPVLFYFFFNMFSDVFCGFLLCTNLTRAPRIGQLQGEIIPTSFYHQGRVIDCR